MAEIIQPRMAEILGMVKEQIEKKGYLHLLGGGIVLTGGGSLLAGTAELAAEIFGLPARIGYPVQLGGLVSGVPRPDVRDGGRPGDVRRLARGSGRPWRWKRREHVHERWDRMRTWFKDFF